MAPTAAFLVMLALMSDPFCFHQNVIIWAPNVLLLTLRRPILVIAACSHILYAGNTHNNHIIASLRRTSRNHVRFKPPPFHQNGIIWAPKAPLLTLPWPILVIASCSHISYAGNTHNNHKITSPPAIMSVSSCIRGRRCHAGQETRQASSPPPQPHWNSCFYRRNKHGKRRRWRHTSKNKISTSSKASPLVNIWRISTSEVGNSI